MNFAAKMKLACLYSNSNNINHKNTFVQIYNFIEFASI